MRQSLIATPEIELVAPIGKRMTLISPGESSLFSTPAASDATFEQAIANLRVHVLDQFLEACLRVKVVRLVRDIGLASGFEWGRNLQKHVDRLGSKRWSNQIRTGERLVLRP